MQPFLPYLTRMMTNFFFQKKDGKEQRLVGHLLLLLAAEVDVRRAHAETSCEVLAAEDDAAAVRRAWRWSSLLLLLKSPILVEILIYIPFLSLVFNIIWALLIKLWLVLLLLSTYLLITELTDKIRCRNFFTLPASGDLNIQNSGAFLCHSCCCGSAIGMSCENFPVLSLVPQQRDNSSGTFAERAPTTFLVATITPRFLSYLSFRNSLPFLSSGVKQPN